ncbi:1753_t:CDS:2, partial [Acaulospora colombiana]
HRLISKNKNSEGESVHPEEYAGFEESSEAYQERCRYGSVESSFVLRASGAGFGNQRNLVDLAKVHTGEKTGKSKQAPFPYVRELTGELIGKAVMKLWKELYGTDAQRAGHPYPANLKIIHIGIAFTGLEPLAPGQRAIDGFLSKSTRTPLISGNGDDVVKEEIVEEIPKDEQLEYVCPECAKKIKYTVLSNDHEELRATKLLAVKSEHEDFHFAQRLAREHTVVVGSGVRKRRRSTSPPIQTKGRKDEGIKRYFQKKWYV